MEGLSAYLLVGLFLVLKQSLKALKLRGHVAVDLEIARDDLFHLADVVVHVLVNDCRCLHTRDNLALLSQQLSSFFQVLQMVFLKLLMLVENVVDLLVERKQVVVHHLHALTSIERLL
jgi:hypothetical protein